MTKGPAKTWPMSTEGSSVKVHCNWYRAGIQTEPRMAVRSVWRHMHARRLSTPAVPSLPTTRTEEIGLFRVRVRLDNLQLARARYNDKVGGTACSMCVCMVRCGF